MGSGIAEPIFPGESPTHAARRLALRKAEAVAGVLRRGWVLGADTVVALDGTILGKPRDLSDARRMLRLLRGTSHQVITAVALLQARTGKRDIQQVVTRVHFADFSDSELEAHLVKGRSLDKAGGYAIQDRTRPLVKGIDGCYYNVVGLPLCELTVLFVDFGLLSCPLALCRLPDRQLCPRFRFPPTGVSAKAQP